MQATTIAELCYIFLWLCPIYFQNMLEELLIHKPDDPIEFMINHLKQNNDDGEWKWRHQK